MSITSAISSAVSALNAQSAALALISNNLANSSTTGYKTSSASFLSLLAGASTGGASSGGVLATTVADISAQGLLATSSTATNVAIYGSGFFPVSSASDSNSLYYTRNGEFSIDSDGYLVNDGYQLQGWATDADGNVIGSQTMSALTSIDVDSISTVASPTTSMSLVANLPADAEVGDTFTSSVELFDSLGTAATSEVTWTKTAENTWTVTFANPTLSSATSGSSIGTVGTGSITLTFNSDGTFASASESTLSISGWTTGGADSSIALDFGTAGTSTGLSQYSSGSDDPKVSLTTDQDGVATGTLSSITIDDDGTVSGVYDNGMTRSLYKIPVATFTNANGLSALSNGIYQATSASGEASLHLSGEDGAGTIYGAELEQSTTDTNTEFSKMMAAQQAYSSAAQVISTGKDMFDTLLSAVR